MMGTSHYKIVGYGSAHTAIGKHTVCGARALRAQRPLTARPTARASEGGDRPPASRASAGGHGPPGRPPGRPPAPDGLLHSAASSCPGTRPACLPACLPSVARGGAQERPHKWYMLRESSMVAAAATPCTSLLSIGARALQEGPASSSGMPALRPVATASRAHRVCPAACRCRCRCGECAREHPPKPLTLPTPPPSTPMGCFWRGGPPAGQLPPARAAAPPPP